MAEQAEHDRPVGGVALAGEGQRAVQRDPDAQPGLGRRIVSESVRKQRHKGRGRGHRSHRVGGGRADADLEELEDAQDHGDDARRFTGPRWLAGDLHPSGRDSPARCKPSFQVGDTEPLSPSCRLSHGPASAKIGRCRRPRERSPAPLARTPARNERHAAAWTAAPGDAGGEPCSASGSMSAARLRT